MDRRRFPAPLAAAIAAARATNGGTVVGPKSRIELDGAFDESDALAGVLPFGTDGGGGVWFCDVDNRVERGPGAILHLHASGAYGDTRYVAASYAELADRLAKGLDPYDLPSFDEQASAALRGVASVPGIDGLVEVRRVHARAVGQPRAAEVVSAVDVRADGLPARAGAPILLTEEGRVHFLTLAADAIVEGVPCLAGTPLALHPATGRPLRFTPAAPIAIDGLPFRAGHEVCVYDPVFSAAVTGVLDRDHDVDHVPLAAGTRVTLQGHERALAAGTLRAATVLDGQELHAGTSFELLGGHLYRTRSGAR